MIICGKAESTGWPEDRNLESLFNTNTGILKCSRHAVTRLRVKLYIDTSVLWTNRNLKMLTCVYYFSLSLSLTQTHTHKTGRSEWPTNIESGCPQGFCL